MRAEISGSLMQGLLINHGKASGKKGHFGNLCAVKYENFQSGVSILVHLSPLGT
jgi:hypothetical protein